MPLDRLTFDFGRVSPSQPPDLRVTRLCLRSLYVQPGEVRILLCKHVVGEGCSRNPITTYQSCSLCSADINIETYFGQVC